MKFWTILYSLTLVECVHITLKRTFLCIFQYQIKCFMSFPETNKKTQTQNPPKAKSIFLKISSVAPLGSEVYWLSSFLALGKDRNSKTQVSWLSRNRTRFFVCLFWVLFALWKITYGKLRKQRTNPQILAKATAEWCTPGRKNGRGLHSTREKNPSLGFLLACRS